MIELKLDTWRHLSDAKTNVASSVDDDDIALNQMKRGVGDVISAIEALQLVDTNLDTSSPPRAVPVLYTRDQIEVEY